MVVHTASLQRTRMETFSEAVRSLIPWGLPCLFTNDIWRFFVIPSISSFNVNTKYIQGRRVNKNLFTSVTASWWKKKQNSIYINTLMHKKQYHTLDSVVLRNALALMLLLASRIHSYRATNLHKSKHLLTRLLCAGAFFFFCDFMNTLLSYCLAGLKRMRERHATTRTALPLSQDIRVEWLANFRAVCRHKVYYKWQCPKMEKEADPWDC